MSGTSAKIGAGGKLFSVCALLFGTNWLTARYLDFPYVWCWGMPLIVPVIQPWAFVFNLIAVGYLCFTALSGSLPRLMGGVLVCVGVFGIRTFLEILFRLGKTCS